MKVVSNSTPLIGLASIGRLGLLRAFFGEIGIAEAVYDETVTNGHEKGAKKIFIREVDSHSQSSGSPCR